MVSPILLTSFFWLNMFLYVWRSFFTPKNSKYEYTNICSYYEHVFVYVPKRDLHLTRPISNEPTFNEWSVFSFDDLYDF